MIDGSDEQGTLWSPVANCARSWPISATARSSPLSGPFSFDERGLSFRSFQLEIEQLGPWRDSIKQVFPGARARRSIWRPSCSEGAGRRRRQGFRRSPWSTAGQISLSGFIPLGSLPADLSALEGSPSLGSTGWGGRAGVGGRSPARRHPGRPRRSSGGWRGCG